MKRFHPGWICLLLALSCGCEAASALFKTSDRIVTADPQAVVAATRWLTIADAGNYAQAFRKFPRRLLAGGPAAEAQFVAELKSHRTPLGRPVRRILVRARFSNTMAGGPDGNYEFLDYKTSFQHKAEALEIVTLTKESGHWVVSGYHFN
jgi:hypothetical protein